MKNLKEKVSEVSSYLERLMEGDVFSEVIEAVRKSDKDLLVQTCKKAGVPDVYTGSIVSLILALPLVPKYPVLV